MEGDPPKPDMASPSESKVPGFCFGIRATDLIFPVCVAGEVRSQVAYVAALGLKRALGVAPGPATSEPSWTDARIRMGINRSGNGVCAPHGAADGFDPHEGYREITDENMYAHMPSVDSDPGVRSNGTRAAPPRTHMLMHCCFPDACLVTYRSGPCSMPLSASDCSQKQAKSWALMCATLRCSQST